MTRSDVRRIRSGDEPMHARSPLRMRLVLASVGLASAIAGVVFFVVEHAPAYVAACAALGVIAVSDIVIIIRHLRQGPHWQPGRDIPPYRPVEEPAEPVAFHAPPTIRTRRRIYLAMMAVCLGLVVNAWTWVRHFSIGAALVMSAIAAVIPPFAAMAANAGGNRDDSWDDFGDGEWDDGWDERWAEQRSDGPQDSEVQDGEPQDGEAEGDEPQEKAS
jgi:hypothetical protein